LNKKSIVVCFSLTALMLVSSFAVFADPVYYPQLFIKSQGRQWYFFGDNPVPMFNAKDVDEYSLRAYYAVPDGAGGVIITYIHILGVNISNDKVTITIDPNEIPSTLGPEDFTTGVTGMLMDGTEFLATGPGFMWRKAGG
jgi:hypothetical protein